jgi:uncharacterized protein
MILRTRLSIELVILTLGVPLALYFFAPQRWMLGGLWLTAAYAWWQWRRMGGASVWNWPALREGAIMRPMLQRFAVCAVLMSALTLILIPERFLSFPQERPLLWAMVMVLYPLLSVIPQEFIFRSFFFARYRELFPHPNVMLTISALSFGLVHILLHNWVALLLSTVGGFLFAHSYTKRRSLALVVAEHALYGCFAFTIGLGFFFYSGAPHKW